MTNKLQNVRFEQNLHYYAGKTLTEFIIGLARKKDSEAKVIFCLIFALHTFFSAQRLYL